MTAKKVYVVTDGAYDDYSIVGIYDNRRKARALTVSLCPSGTIETYELNPTGMEVAGLHYFYIRMCKDGIIDRMKELKVDDSYELANLKKNPILKLRHINRFEECICKGDSVLTGYVFAKNIEQAIKTMNDERKRLNEKGEWK